MPRDLQRYLDVALFCRDFLRLEIRPWQVAIIELALRPPAPSRRRPSRKQIAERAAAGEPLADPSVGESEIEDPVEITYSHLRVGAGEIRGLTATHAIADDLTGGAET